MRVALTDVRWRRAAAHVLLLASLLAPAAAQSPSSNNTRPPSRQARRPAPLAEYRERVRRAFELVEKLALFYEDYEAEEPEVGPEDVRELLPASERVEWGDGFVEVDNSWVHEALKPLAAVEDDLKTAEGLRALAGRLRALEARLGEMDAAPTAALDRDAERGRLNSILRRPEFDRQAPRQQGQGALQRMVEDFIEWLISLFPRFRGGVPGGSPRVSKWILALVGGLCLLVLAYVARSWWLRRGTGRRSLGLKRDARVVLGERLEADQTASDLLDEAERLARAGELRGAIRKAYVALLCELGDRGVVRLAQHKTNRDYLDAVRRAASQRLYTEMLPLTYDFELHWYGLRAASDADWQSFKTRCRAALKEIGSIQ
ncbi:MAG: hypothetical protein ACJ754_17720 [Pyrinomonadaceae bacterium]